MEKVVNITTDNTWETILNNAHHQRDLQER